MADLAVVDLKAPRPLLRLLRWSRLIKAEVRERWPMGESHAAAVQAALRRHSRVQKWPQTDAAYLKATVSALAQLRAVDKGATLRALRGTPEFARLFAPDAPPWVQKIAVALTTRRVNRVGSRFPRNLKPLFPVAPSIREGVSHQPEGEAYHLRALPQRASAGELLAAAELREPLLEVWRGTVTTGRALPDGEGPVLVPVAPVFPEEQGLTVSAGGEERRVRLEPGCFTYLRLAGGDRIAGDLPFVAGDPVALRRERGRLPRIVLSLFLDGLSSRVFDAEPFEQLMPATHAFFSKGFVTLDARSAAEWTLPSIASISTGVRPAFHRVVNRRRFRDVAPRNGSNAYFPAIMRDLGFVTAQFCANWRRSGGYGYFRGFDRTVTCHGRYPAEEVVADALEHLHVFRDAPQYLWLTCFDLHHDHGAAPEFMVRAEEGTDFVEDLSVKSVFQRHSEGKARWYREKIRRLDRVLGGLYAHLERTYDDEDMVVGLFSDHGVSFLKREPDARLKRLTDGRVTVPVMFRGRGLGAIPADRKVQNYDHFPTLLSAIAPVETLVGPGTRLDGIDLTRADRAVLVSETIYPGQPYACRVETGRGIFQCVAGQVRPDATFDLSVLRLHQQVDDAWIPRPIGDMPDEMRAVLAEYG